MGSRLSDQIARWADLVGIDPRLVPSASELRLHYSTIDPCRAPADPRELAAWERRHGYALPRAVRAWLRLSDGFHLRAPLVHPLHSIGPMVAFARFPDLMIQPESWFEVGNPESEPICVDLAYRWPGGDCPVFTSGDDATGRPARIIAPSFSSWFLRLVREGGREFWNDPDFVPLGDPWLAHRRHAPAPPLPERLRGLADQVRPMLKPGADVDDRSIAASLGISRNEVETIFRHLQHRPVEGALGASCTFSGPCLDLM